MILILAHRTYAKLFTAQVIALLGTGLLTIALGLLAFDVAAGDAGVVMGLAMTIKMIAYVAAAPVATALVASLPRQAVLIGADLVRAAVALSLPFVSQAWQIYPLVFVLQCASATFTPTFQAVIPSVLPDEKNYTRALSLSRLAYDVESLLSPVLAAALLSVISYHNLFVGTVIGFLASAVLVAASRLPAMGAPARPTFLQRLSDGMRLFGRVSELRGLMGLNLVVSTATAMVIVNTVVIVQGHLGRGQSDVALLLAAYGGGSMVVALGVPAALDRLADRAVMTTGGAILPVLLLAVASVLVTTTGPGQWMALTILWFLLGAATSTVLTPSARLLRRHSTEGTRPAVYAAQFSLSHACFLVTYPLAGILGARIGMPLICLVLSGGGIVGLGAAIGAWYRPGRRAPMSLDLLEESSPGRRR